MKRAGTNPRMARRTRARSSAWARICLLCSTAAVLGACGEAPAEEAPERMRPVKIVEVAAASDARTLTFPAVVRASQSAELTFQVPGEIRELNILEGQEIGEGVLIAKLDQRNAQNNLDRARAEYRNAEAEYQRAERLVRQDAISRSVLDARRTQRDVTRVAVADAERALRDTVLAAPFDGVISKVYPQQFQNVQAKEPIALIQSDDVEAVINIPGAIIAQVPRLQPYGTTVQLDAAPDLKIQAEFSEAAGQADPNTQTYEVTFRFQPPEDLYILPGMTASVTTTFGFSEVDRFPTDGVAAPLSSILAEGDKTYVWVVDPSAMTITKREVAVDSDPGETVTVVNGLESGEMIVSAGVAYLHEGMRVRPWTPQ